jgi:hypothetical protein
VRLSGANAAAASASGNTAPTTGLRRPSRTRAARSASRAPSDSTEVLVTAGRFGGRQCARLARRSESQISTLLPSNWIQPRWAKSASALFTVSREAPTSWAISSWVRS